MNRPRQQKQETDNNNGWLLALGGLALGVVGTLIGKKVVDNINQEQNIQIQQASKTTDGQDEIYETLVCPITGELIQEAAQINVCGHTFERTALEAWLTKSQCCPQCRVAANKNNIIKNYSLQQVIDCQRGKK